MKNQRHTISTTCVLGSHDKLGILSKLVRVFFVSITRVRDLVKALKKALDLWLDLTIARDRCLILGHRGCAKLVYERRLSRSRGEVVSRDTHTTCQREDVRFVLADFPAEQPISDGKSCPS